MPRTCRAIPNRHIINPSTLTKYRVAFVTPARVLSTRKVFLNGKNPPWQNIRGNAHKFSHQTVCPSCWPGWHCCAGYQMDGAARCKYGEWCVCGGMGGGVGVLHRFVISTAARCAHVDRFGVQSCWHQQEPPFPSSTRASGLGSSLSLLSCCSLSFETPAGGFSLADSVPCLLLEAYLVGVLGQASGLALIEEVLEPLEDEALADSPVGDLAQVLGWLGLVCCGLWCSSRWCIKLWRCSTRWCSELLWCSMPSVAKQALAAPRPWCNMPPLALAAWVPS